MEEEKFNKPDFGKPSQNYVPGLGRGAIGFQTRLDFPPSFSSSNFDPFFGQQKPLFQSATTKQDLQAQQIYNKIDIYMQGRRKKQRQEGVKKQLQKINKYGLSFIDLKRQLGKITEEQWKNIPQTGDKPGKKVKRNSFVPLPDHLIGSFQNKQQGQIVQEKLEDLGKARGQRLQFKLKQKQSKIAGQTVINPDGYLTVLNQSNNHNYIGDIKKAELLYKSAIQSNPKNSYGWIGLSRLLVMEGRNKQARQTLTDGLQVCFNSQDLWLEAARIQKPQKCKSILAKGVSKLPNAISLWMQAANKQQDKQIKQQILKKGLQFNPESVTMWKELIEIVSKQEASQLFRRAVQFLPGNLQMWLSWAKIQNYEQAKHILSNAVKHLPYQPTLFIYGCMLEQTNGEKINQEKTYQKILRILQKGKKSLKKKGVTIKNQQMIEYACQAEKKSCLLTSRGIIQKWVDINTGTGNENYYGQTGCTQVGRILLLKKRQTNPNKQIYKESILYEQKYNLPSLQQLLKQSLQLYIKDQDFWIQIIKIHFGNKEYQLTFNIVDQALQAVYNKQQIYALKGKLNRKMGKYEQSKKVFQEMRKLGMIKGWQLGLKICIKLSEFEQGLQITKNIPQSFSEYYNKLIYKLSQFIQVDFIPILNQCKDSIYPYFGLIDKQIKKQNYHKVQPIIQKAKKNCKDIQKVYLKAIQIDKKRGNLKSKKVYQAIQKFNSDVFWNHALQINKRISVQALTNCPDSPMIHLTIAKIFYKEKKNQKAKKWFQKALLKGMNNGDCWAYCGAMLIQDKPKLDQLMNRFKTYKIEYGEIWQLVRWKGYNKKQYKFLQMIEIAKLSLTKEQ